MCNYKILSHNPSGYIILCNTCGHYQLGFGTMAITFWPNIFTRFCKQVNHLKNATSCNGFEKQKRISINIFSQLVTMVLSYAELLQLSELVNEAQFDEQLEQIIHELNLVRK